MRFAGSWRRLGNGLRKQLARHVARAIFQVDPACPRLEFLGEGDGAWPVPADFVRPDWICYCLGVGINATLDVTLTKRFGCQVHSFDPTPRSIEYMTTLEYDRSLLHFNPIGIWKNDTELRFFAPANRNHANWSVVDLHGTGDYFTARCKRLSTVMREHGHDRLDLLKMDIEGSWFEVIESLLHDQISIRVLCVEFDSPTSLGRLRRVIRALTASGMRLVHFHRENYVFVHQSLLA